MKINEIMAKIMKSLKMKIINDITIILAEQYQRKYNRRSSFFENRWLAGLQPANNL
jgi:hypothetical protein